MIEHEKKLPIVLDTVIISECWTFSKLAVIQTSPYAEDWLASHMTLHRTWYNGYFGDYNSVYDPIYYEDILTIRELDFFNLDEDGLIKIIRQHIDQGKYIQLYTDWNISGKGKPIFHEVLIYGYNDEKRIFYAPAFRGRRFREAEYSYDHIKKSLSVTLDELKISDINRFFVSQRYHFLFCSIALRADYSPDRCVYTALRKIENEARGLEVQTHSIESDWKAVAGEIRHFGISNLHALLVVVKYIIKNKDLPDWQEKLSVSFKQNHENKTLILLAMNYIVRKWKITVMEAMSLIDAYQRCCDRAEKWYLAALKYESRPNKTIPQQICEEIPKAFTEEQETLQKFISICLDWYKAHYEEII